MNRMERIIATISATLMIVGAVWGVWSVYSFRRVPDTPPMISPTNAIPVVRSVKKSPVMPIDLRAFFPEEKKEKPVVSALSTMHRLVGTYFSQNTAHAWQAAVLESRQDGGQHVVTLGEAIDGWILVDVAAADATFERDNQRLVMGIEGDSRTETAPSTTPETVAMANSPGWGSTRFGKQVAADRWIFEKQKLNEYYDEMLDNPERLANLYMSLKPDYDGKRNIKGYVLDMEGEEAFFRQVGLKQGDIIRKVNSMVMKSQHRAEYFLREFSKDHLGAVVLEIERDNAPQKMIYLLK
ncbi:MAG: hypothetical protein EOL87_01670 [Spartobacteria bacterium]|nr:hypothetical protein [Spartobacteria bacterium]